MTDQHDLFDPPDEDEPRLPPDEVRRRLAEMKALLPTPRGQPDDDSTRD